MKTALALAALVLLPATSFASQLGCATTVSITVSQMLHAEDSKNLVVRSVNPLASPSKNILQYRVIATAEGLGIPYSASYIVTAKKGPMATCQVESVELEQLAQ